MKGYFFAYEMTDAEFWFNEDGTVQDDYSPELIGVRLDGAKPGNLKVLRKWIEKGPNRNLTPELLNESLN